MRRPFVTVCSLVLLVITADALRAQSMNAGPMSEASIGIEQLTGYENGTSVGSRTGVMMMWRGSFLAPLSLRATQGRFLIADYTEGGLGLYGGSSLLDGVRVPAVLGGQVGVLLGTQIQIIARGGFQTGYGYDGVPGRYVGGRIRVGPIAVEGARVSGAASGARMESALVRWYPRVRAGGLNILVRWESERGKTGGLLGQGPEDQRALQLGVSIER